MIVNSNTNTDIGHHDLILKYINALLSWSFHNQNIDGGNFLKIDIRTVDSQCRSSVTYKNKKLHHPGTTIANCIENMIRKHQPLDS